MQLIARRGDKVDLALVPIGGHYTMDRFDAVTAVELIEPAAGDPLPLQHVPADRDRRQAFKQDVQNAGFSEVVSCSSPARRHTLK